MSYCSNNAIRNKVLKEKKTVLDSIACKQDSDVLLCGVEEDIALWAFQIDSVPVYFYTNLQGKLIFGDVCFFKASAFSKSCAWVKTMDKEWYIINREKKELIKIPYCDMPWQNIRDIRNGNLALLNEKNLWGSYFYDQEEHIFQNDIPFIWNALEFSRKEKFAYAGIFSSKSVVNSSNEWGPEHVFFQLIVSQFLKDCLYNLDIYQHFLRDYFTNPSLGIDITETKIPTSLQEKECLKKQFIAYAHNIADYYNEKEDSLFNTNLGKIRSVENLKDYTRVLGKVKK